MIYDIQFRTNNRDTHTQDTVSFKVAWGLGVTTKSIIGEASKIDSREKINFYRACRGFEDRCVTWGADHIYICMGKIGVI